MSDTELIVDVHPDERAITARVPVNPTRVLGFIHGTSHSTEPITAAIRRLTAAGAWYLWVTDAQVRIGGLGKPNDYPSPYKGYRRVPLRSEWMNAHGLGELLDGDYFFLTLDRSAITQVGFLAEDECRYEPTVRKLPEGADAFVAFDPDLEWFDAVFSDELFNDAVALIDGVAQHT